MGKGGGSARTPVEAPNTLQSKSVARLVDLLCEGPIGGLVDGDSSIFLDGTPLRAADGRLNFSGVTFTERVGEPDQAHIPGFPAIEAERSVGVQMEAGNPVVQTLQGTDLDAARVTVRLPALYEQLLTDDRMGDMVGGTVQFNIDWSDASGVWVRPILNRAWKDFATVTADSTTGLQVTAYDMAEPGDEPKGKYSIRVEYRKVGDTAWSLLGASSGTVDNLYDSGGDGGGDSGDMGGTGGGTGDDGGSSPGDSGSGGMA